MIPENIREDLLETFKKYKPKYIDRDAKENNEYDIHIVEKKKPLLLKSKYRLALDQNLPGGNNPLKLIESLELQIRSEPLGIFLFTSLQSDWVNTFRNICEQILQNTRYRYIFIIKRDLEVLVWDKYDDIYFKKLEELPLSIEKTIETSHEGTRNRIEQIGEKILSKFERAVKRKKAKQKEREEFARKLLNDYINHIGYDFKRNTFGIKGGGPTLTIGKEIELIRKLFRSDEIKEMYRYGSLSTLKATLDSGKYRMNCIMGMNDSSEVSYADNHLGGDAGLQDDSHLNKVHNINRKYISSCSSEEDDLTLWRFYGDDTRGMSIKLVPKAKKYKHGDFIFGYVSYAEENGAHPELELLRALVAGTNAHGEVYGSSLLNIWKHFFKPYDYHVEKEIRIFYFLPDGYEKKNLGWNISNYGFLNPYMEFDMHSKEFPFRIEEVMLGPQTPEKIINKHQIRALMSYKEFTDSNARIPQVKYSSIGNYRGD